MLGSRDDIFVANISIVANDVILSMVLLLIDHSNAQSAAMLVLVIADEEQASGILYAL